MPERREKILILGAAGRDFHNFNVVYRNDKQSNVVGFTATQIPGIDNRMYPPVLSGELYPDGLQIWSQDDLEKIVKEHKVDRCILSYSDLPYNKVMEAACRCLASGADFGFLCPERTMLESTKKVVAVTAVRTGCGKSQTSHYIINTLKKCGLRVVLVRHPMPYGDLAKEAVQRFATFKDLDDQQVTIEEREEYEQHLLNDTIVYAGVDYERILREAEKECDVVVWDGGNNDTPFYKPDLWITITDPHRVGAEVSYYPGDQNFRMADVITINKVNTAPEGTIDVIKKHAEEMNPNAAVFLTDSTVSVDDASRVKGKKVVIVDDGPTITHGDMAYGAGKFAAEKNEAAEIVDPRPYFKGSIMRTYRKYPHIGKTTPAMGYSPQQIKDLAATLEAVPADTVLIATPMDLRKVMDIKKDCAVVRYVVEEKEGKLAQYITEKAKGWTPEKAKGWTPEKSTKVKGA